MYSSSRMPTGKVAPWCVPCASVPAGHAVSSAQASAAPRAATARRWTDRRNFRTKIGARLLPMRQFSPRLCANASGCGDIATALLRDLDVIKVMLTLTRPAMTSACSREHGLSNELHSLHRASHRLFRFERRGVCPCVADRLGGQEQIATAARVPI